MANTMWGWTGWTSASFLALYFQDAPTLGLYSTLNKCQLIIKSMCNQYPILLISFLFSPLAQNAGSRTSRCLHRPGFKSIIF
jgi:hypothetical protein